MKNLYEKLKNEHYKKIKFRVSKTNHLLITASVNGIKGNFILDTGASNSCVGFDNIAHFKLTTVDSKTKAAGAGAVNMLTQIAAKNKLKLGVWKYTEFNLVVFDMSHVNQALKQHKAKAVNGIIGADVLLKGEAIIDYANRYLYLKNK